MVALTIHHPAVQMTLLWYSQTYWSRTGKRVPLDLDPSLSPRALKIAPAMI